MKAVIQRVTHSSVTVDGKIISSIGKGMMILLGVGYGDTIDDISWLVRKISQMRIFPDENDVMNLSVMDVGGEVLVVSQFTLMASCKKGNRPSYIAAATPDIAVPLYESFCKELSSAIGKKVQTGEFGADMKVELLNDGPVTICLDSKNPV
ncbi:MAG: D-tyrosyl-tRNA(Tyr) deacylase [Bacteroidales bacterium]|jgi:D-tyrosyl-tRNA(Tyr) deacylase|nr:D-tyrosyl-tRNA(Tyr) deacylase [Bacteroidales bacterium]MBQ6578130.1 D-tyrosyl-tRNA(Tyr) deacylase [Bacteroidales bacterium]